MGGRALCCGGTTREGGQEGHGTMRGGSAPFPAMDLPVAPYRWYNDMGKEIHGKEASMEYTLYCDESISKDRKFGDFFGGCIVDNRALPEIEAALNQCKAINHLDGEIKWTKLTAPYLEKYIDVIHLFFDYVRAGKIRVRIMFRSMEDSYAFPAQQKGEKYFKLYYQFIKHGFGFLQTAGLAPFYVRIYLDQMPNKRLERERFKQFLYEMTATRDFVEKKSAVRIRRDQIAEVSSHDHVLMQCADIILGAMQFRLNEHHLDKPDGQRYRGKKTVAKEKMYRAIHREICTIHENFNIGVSTGARNYARPHWESPYEHWKFTASGHPENE